MRRAVGFVSLAAVVVLAGVGGVPSPLAVGPAAADSTEVSVAELRRDLGDGVVALKSPTGGTVDFQVEPSRVMEPGLAARHPELRSYVGRSVSDPTTTVALSVTPLGVSASVRGADAWVVESEPRGLLRSSADPEPSAPADLSEPALPPDVESGVSERLAAAAPPSGEVVQRTYRLALVNDPTYADYFGTENVLAAKVALVTRLNQVYNDDLGVRFVLVDGTERLNLDTRAEAVRADGPCGSSPCYERRGPGGGMLDRCGIDTLGRTRLVLANLIGASAYDVGHLVLGVDGGGVAYLGVAGRDYAGGGCTGLEKPQGDFFHVDYVAHELGHQFAANHTFNGDAGACAGNGMVSSVEPGSGSSIMAYAGICGPDDLQPHTDPYFSQHTLDEAGTYIRTRRKGVVEVQQVSLRGFSTDGDSVVLTLGGRSVTLVRGENYTRGGVQRAMSQLTGAEVRVAGWGYDPYLERFGGPGPGRPSDAGFQVVYSASLAKGGAADRVDRPEPSVVGGPGVTAALVEVAQGGASRNRGAASPSGNARPEVTAPARVTVPVRTPFVLSGAGSDADGDALTYSWEQDDAGVGTPLLSNRKVFGPLFRQFGDNARVSESGALESPSPGQNAASTTPVRYFPDLAQVLRGVTNAETGRCPRVRGDVVRDRVRDCYSEFLPTSAYRGAAGVGGRVMHFRLTARDAATGGGGTSYADTAVRIDRSGPFLVRSSPSSLESGSSYVLRWSVNGTRSLSRSVRVRLSTDDGATWDTVLAARTLNDGKQKVQLPAGVTADAAWFMVEARNQPFFAVGERAFELR